MKKAVRLSIIGSMQGIFYRQFIKKIAEEQGIKGFLRFKDGGLVEIFIEGETGAVDAAVVACKQGPRHSQIRSIEEKSERLQDFSEFKVYGF